MKRPTFLTIWLCILLLFSLAITTDSLTYLPFIFLTKSYISLVGIIACFVQIWAVIALLRWKKKGITLYLSSAIAVFLVTAINEFSLVSKLNQLVISLLAVVVVNIIMLGILYVAIKPVWKNFD